MRGSTLLLIGRMLSIGINLISQALIARYLSQAEFGAFALAIGIAGVGQVFITLGLHRGATQYFARYEEAGDHQRLVGTILVNIGVIVGLGIILILAVVLAQGLLTASGLLDPTATALLLVLVALAPIDALDDVLIALFAVMGSSRQIFLRRYLVGPLLRLLAVAALVFSNGDALQLAIGYFVATVLGLVVYGTLFVRLLARRGVMQSLRDRPPTAPAREILRFSLPLLSNDGVWLLVNTLPLLVLTAARGLEEVAAFQVIRPAASLNTIVASSFYVLYLPVASRMAVRHDREASAQLFWQTVIWVSVISFPIFAGTFAFGRPIAGLLFGERYESSGTYLSILAIGYAMNATFGISGTTLAAHGHTRTVAVVNVMSALLGVALTLVLIPLFGALGAAVAAALTLVFQSLMLHVRMHRDLGIPLLDRDAARVFTVVGLGTVILVAFGALTPFGFWTVVAGGVVSLGVFLLNRDVMRIGTLFPEIGVILDRIDRLLPKRMT
ncbi:MAG TPA: oligosaccharide flippase family protein [Candidatus Limnocylindrales bacterium]|nr:oligosaccharide flippase family protein [Candidatus Limnocylindrales bacterium]